MNHIDLLNLCHAYLRGAEINEPTGRKPIDRDRLAREINLYLNQSCFAPTANNDPESSTCGPEPMAPSGVDTDVLTNTSS